MPERVRTNTQAVLRLAWGGLAKGNQSCNKPKQVSFLERKSIKVTGPGARIFRAWGPGLGAGKRGPGLGARAGLGAAPSQPPPPPPGPPFAEAVREKRSPTHPPRSAEKPCCRDCAGPTLHYCCRRVQSLMRALRGHPDQHAQPGVWDPVRGLRPGPSRAWGLGHQAPFMRTEVATTKPKRKLRCSDATRLIQTRLPGLRTGNQLVQQADVARTVSDQHCLGWVRGPSKAWGPGPQGLGAQAPSGLLAGYYASLSCKGKKERFHLSYD